MSCKYVYLKRSECEFSQKPYDSYNCFVMRWGYVHSKVEQMKYQRSRQFHWNFMSMRRLSHGTLWPCISVYWCVYMCRLCEWDQRYFMLHFEIKSTNHTDKYKLSETMSSHRKWTPLCDCTSFNCYCSRDFIQSHYSNTDFEFHWDSNWNVNIILRFEILILN